MLKIYVIFPSVKSQCRSDQFSPNNMQISDNSHLDFNFFFECNGADVLLEE